MAPRWLLAAAILVVAAHAGRAADQPAKYVGGQECDRLAQPPRSVMGSLPAYAEGVAPDRIDGEAALAACELAARDHPDETRFRAWLGRALERLDRGTEAVATYLWAANRGHPIALINLATRHMDGRGVVKDPALAASLLKLAADQGLPVAQHNLAVSLVNGLGVDKDEATACVYFRLAAQQGYALAQYSTALCFATGTGGAKDMAAAAAYFRLAADQGNRDAQTALGWLLSVGGGVARNDREAVRYYRLAAEQGDAAAQFNVGTMYADGRGTTQDQFAATAWYRRSADAGNGRAMKFLADNLSAGVGTAADAAEALRYYVLATGQGDSDAMFAVGLAYQDGKGATKNIVTATDWFDRTVAAGNPKPLLLRAMLAGSERLNCYSLGDRETLARRPGSDRCPSIEPERSLLQQVLKFSGNEYRDVRVKALRELEKIGYPP